MIQRKEVAAPGTPVHTECPKAIENEATHVGSISIGADTTKTTGSYIPSLDGLRAIAIAMVLFHHGMPGSYGVFARSAATPLKEFFYNMFVRAGGAGVTLFFALSAFLISSLLKNENIKFGSIDIKKFYARRCLRIWPLYFTALVLITGPFFYMNGGTAYQVLPGAFAFIGNWTGLPNNLTTFGLSLTPFWSLCVEEQFYLVWPHFQARLSLKNLNIASGVVIAVAVVSRLYIAFTKGGSDIAWFNTLPQLDALGWGALAGLNSGQLRRIFSPGQVKLTLLGFFAVVLLQAAVGPVALGNPTLSFSSAILYGFTGLASAALVFVVACEGSARRTFLAWKPMIGLGKISFGVYVWHGVMIMWLRPHLLFTDRWLGLACYVAVSILVAAVSYFVIEQPVLAYKERFKPTGKLPNSASEAA